MSNTIDSVRALGLVPPTDAAELAALAGRLRELTVTADEPTTALLAEYRAGKLAKLTGEKLANRIVGAVAASDQAKAARTTAHYLAEQVERDADVALRAHADELIEAYRPTFDAAVDVLKVALAAGVTSSTTVSDALALGADAGRAFLATVDATATLSAARGLVVEVTGLSGMLIGPERFITAASVHKIPAEVVSGFHIFTAVDKAGFIFRDHSKPVWLALLEAGFSLRLNTRDEAAEVVAAGEAQRARMAVDSKPAVKPYFDLEALGR